MNRPDPYHLPHATVDDHLSHDQTYVDDLARRLRQKEREGASPHDQPQILARPVSKSKTRRLKLVADARRQLARYNQEKEQA